MHVHGASSEYFISGPPITAFQSPVWVSTMKKARPFHGAGLSSFEEAVAASHVVFPGLELGIPVRGHALEELLGGDQLEGGGFDEETRPERVEVPTKLPEAGRGHVA